MAKEICISSTPHETRLAILEDDQLAEIYYERENEYTLAGSIYNGRVTRVLPGMQSAFVDLGLERDAFLYVTDFIELEDQEETDELEKAAASGAGQAPREVKHPHGVDSNGAGAPDDSQRAPIRRGVEERPPGRTGPASGPNRQPRRASAAEEARRRHRITPFRNSGCSGPIRAARRIRMKQGHAAGVDGAAGVVAAGRAIEPASRSEFEPVPLAVTESQIRSGASPRRFKLQTLRRHRVGIMRQHLLCCPANRFRSMAARPALKARSRPRNRRHRAARRAHSSPPRLSKHRSLGTAADCYRASRSHCAAREAEPPLKRRKRRKTIWPRSPRQNLFRKNLRRDRSPLSAELHESELRDPEEAPFEFEEEELASDALETLTEDELPAPEGER